ncbi:hypothetical protein, partial [Streptomyces sp. DH12]|uniref:hypothetical protein n=1 Tax=Streptomyces sp. DH12 TaxID=2857010 RepID=UPI001E49F41A
MAHGDLRCGAVLDGFTTPEVFAVIKPVGVSNALDPDTGSRARALPPRSGTAGADHDGRARRDGECGG